MRQTVEGTLHVPLPDEPAARAKAFGEVAAAWSQMLSMIEHLLPNGAEGGGKLMPGSERWYAGRLPLVSAEKPQMAANSVPPPPNDDHRAPEHMAKMRDAKARKAKDRKGKRK